MPLCARCTEGGPSAMPACPPAHQRQGWDFSGVMLVWDSVCGSAPPAWVPTQPTAAADSRHVISPETLA